MSKIQRPEILDVYQIKMRTPDAGENKPEPAEDLLVAVNTLQQAIDFVNAKFSGKDITMIQRTDEQIYYGLE